MRDNLTRLFRDDAGHGKWRLCAGISLGALILTYWPQGLTYFRYDRDALLAGQAWRLLTAHLVHLNTAHLLFNLGGMFLLCELLWRDLPVAQGAGVLVATAITVSGSLYWFHPELAWYAGLSGALHGLWAGCALAGCRPSHADVPAASGASRRKLLQIRWPMMRCISAAGIICLIAKLAMEAHYGASSHTVQMIGSPVVTIAHLYGALAGGFYILIWLSMQPRHIKK
jgi:rhomboid family GlyGly-CTERM serine protease